MSDKYEEMAIRATVECLPNEESPLLMEILPRAFRWYEETYLADALTAAAMMREKETCETCNQHGHCFVEDTFVRCNEHHIPLKHGCVNHSGRRIVEKVQPPEGGAR